MHWQLQTNELLLHFLEAQLTTRSFAPLITASILRNQQITNIDNIGGVFSALLLLRVNNKLRFAVSFKQTHTFNQEFYDWDIDNDALFLVLLKDLLRAFSCPMDEFKSEAEEHEEINQMLQNGKLMFNHYVAVSKKSLIDASDNRSLIKKCFEAGCALRLIENVIGADLLLPVCFTNTQKQIDFGALLVQMTCNGSKINDNETFGRKLASSFVFPPALQQTTSIGLVLPFAKIEQWQNYEQKCFVNNVSVGQDGVLTYEQFVRTKL